MNLDTLITTTLSPLGYAAYANQYDGDDDIFFVFNYTTYPDGFWNDEANAEKHLVQIHLFAPHGDNINALRKKTKKAIVDAGLTWPSEVNASETSCQHYVYECEIITGADGNG